MCVCVLQLEIGYLTQSLPWTSLAVQWLRLCISTAGGMGSIPGGGTKIPHAAWRDQNQNPKPKQKAFRSRKSLCNPT